VKTYTIGGRGGQGGDKPHFPVNPDRSPHVHRVNPAFFFSVRSSCTHTYTGVLRTE